MRYAVVLLLLTIYVGGCKKKESLSPGPGKTDSSKNAPALLSQDVKWRVHFQGTYRFDLTKGYYFDTSYHYYTEVSAGGFTATIAGFNYFVYPGVVTAYCADSLIYNFTGELYLRTKATADTVFSNNFFGNTYSYDIPVWNSVKVGDSVYSDLSPGTIVSCDTMLIGGTSFALYKVRVTQTNKTYFYSADGIGGQSGFFYAGAGPYSGNGSQIKDMDFIYKGDSIHFEYDLF
jgi:hypothetical protein